MSGWHRETFPGLGCVCKLQKKLRQSCVLMIATETAYQETLLLGQIVRFDQFCLQEF